MYSGKVDKLAVAFKTNSLFQVLVRLHCEFLGRHHAIPNTVLGTAEIEERCVSIYEYFTSKFSPDTQKENDVRVTEIILRSYDINLREHLLLMKKETRIVY